MGLERGGERGEPEERRVPELACGRGCREQVSPRRLAVRCSPAERSSCAAPAGAQSGAGGGIGLGLR